MKLALSGLSITALVVSLSGCGGGSHDSAMKEAINATNEMADILEKSKTADEAKPKMEAVVAKMKDLKKRMDKLGEPSKSEAEALGKKYAGDMMTAGMRMMKAQQAFQQRDPEGFQKLEALLKEAQ